MPIETSLDIVSPNPNSQLITRLDGAGIANGLGDLVTHYPPIVWKLTGTDVDTFIFTNFHTNVIFRIFAIRVNTNVVGGAGATLQVMVCPQGVAIASGIAQMTSTLDLTTTAPAKLSGALITPPTDIGPGDSIGLDFTGTITGLVGALTVGLRRIR